ncbi:MAG: DUF4167 domain-containing protein [Alphaproteobacteria bacterium]|nr:DUF4167 domain-containing protein [Alphaproteobacteria bacterium]
MRQSPTSKRGRGRSGGRRSYGNSANRSYDSSGPDVKIRGTANQIYDKYQLLARDAAASGDRVAAENYLQHAEHYFRIISANAAAQANTASQNNNAAQQGQAGTKSVNGRGRGNGQQPPMAASDEARTIEPEQSGPTMFQPVTAEQPAVDAETEASDEAAVEAKPARKRARNAEAPKVAEEAAATDDKATIEEHADEAESDATAAG